MRRCSKCGQMQDLSCFYMDRARKAGCQSQCKACQRIGARAWQAANPERNHKSHQDWKAANPERQRDSNRAWCAANPERVRELARARYAANPDKCKAKLQRRRAAKLGLFVENVSRSVLLDRDCRVCGICELQIAVDHPNRLYRPSIDHIVPLSKGGKHSYANTQSAHLLCNIRKGAKLL